MSEYRPLHHLSLPTRVFYMLYLYIFESCSNSSLNVPSSQILGVKFLHVGKLFFIFIVC